MPARVGSVISPVGDMCVYARVGYIISTVGNIVFMFSTFFSYRYTYMWTLPDHQGGSLKWTLKFLLKHTTFYQNFKISLIWIKNFPIYSTHFWKTSLKWKENLPDALLKLITCMDITCLQDFCHHFCSYMYFLSYVRLKFVISSSVTKIMSAL